MPTMQRPHAAQWWPMRQAVKCCTAHLRHKLLGMQSQVANAALCACVTSAIANCECCTTPIHLHLKTYEQTYCRTATTRSRNPHRPPVSQKGQKRGVNLVATVEKTLVWVADHQMLEWVAGGSEQEAISTKAVPSRQVHSSEMRGAWALRSTSQPTSVLCKCQGTSPLKGELATTINCAT